MKKYYICKWMYYSIICKDIIIAENKDDAKQLAISYIKTLGGIPRDIISIEEFTDDCCITKDKVDKLYKRN